VRSVLAVPLLLMPLWQAGEPANDPAPRDPTARAGYSLGHQIGSDLLRQGTPVDVEALRRGLLDALAGAEPALDEAEMQRALGDLKRKLSATERRERREADARERERGEAFLAENAKRPDVVTLDSGLQYTVIEKGRGRRPGATDRVVVHYRGTTLDGKVFHDSRDRPGEPETLHVSGVILGLTEALQRMKVGARWRLFLPPDLAYGRRGPLRDHTVIFDVELIAIEDGS